MAFRTDLIIEACRLTLEEIRVPTEDELKHIIPAIIEYANFAHCPINEVAPSLICATRYALLENPQ